MQADQVAKVVGAFGAVIVGVLVIAKIAVWHLAADALCRTARWRSDCVQRTRLQTEVIKKTK
jgi:hypothetical protein